MEAAEERPRGTLVLAILCVRFCTGFPMFSDSSSRPLFLFSFYMRIPGWGHFSCVMRPLLNRGDKSSTMPEYILPSLEGNRDESGVMEVDVTVVV